MITTFQIHFQKKLKPYNSSNISSNLGMRCRYFTVMLSIARQSTHIHQVLSFFGTSTGATQGLMLFRMYPFNINSPICLWSSLVSSGLLLKAGLVGIEAPRTKLIWCSTPLIGSKPLGMSSENTSLNYSKRTLTTLGAQESKSSKLKNASLYTSQIIGKSER